MPKDLPQYVRQASIPSLRQVQFSNAQAETTRAISSELGAVAADMKRKSTEIDKLKATTTLRTELSRMSQEAGADPALMRQKVDNFKSGFIKGIENPDLAAQFEARYDLEALPYIDKATAKYNANLDTELETFALEDVKMGIDYMKTVLPGLQSNVPEIRESSQAALDSVFNDIAETATLRRTDGTFVFTPQQQMAMAGEAQKEYLYSLPNEERLKVLEKGGEHLDLLTTSAKESIKQATIRAINQDLKLKREDPAKWGLSRGMDIGEIVAMQGDPETASVIPKDQAKQITQRIKEFENPDDVIQLANELKAQYGDFTFNAVRDLTQAKMPDESQAAINLAIQDPVGNHERIRMLHEVSKLGDSGLNELYKTTTFEGMFGGSTGDINTIQDQLTEESAEMLEAMSREGYSLQDRLREYKVLDNVAKAYRVKNPTVSEAEAVDFALSIERERFNQAELNDTQYRVPRFDPDGTVYDVDEIEDRLEAHYEGLEFKVDVLGVDIASSVGRNIKELAVPFLNAKQTGIRFRSPSGEVLKDKSGKVAELLFKDIVAQPTPEELKPKPKFEGVLGPIE